MIFVHIPVLFNETIDSLNIKEDGIYIDGTAGGAGHSKAIAEKITTGRLLSIDQDPDAVKVASERLLPFSHAKVVRGNFSDMTKIAHENDIIKVDGILLDIGVSSYQLDNESRGFSYHSDAPLDMRMSQTGMSAEDVVNDYTWQELARIISQYGEDKNAVRIAKSIVNAREEKRIETTVELAEIIKDGLPYAVKRKEGHPARKAFQAIRIEVNGELEKLKLALTDAFELLNVGGRLSVITFHSLEDRIVKDQMKNWCIGCTCPKDFPVCICGKTPKGKIIYKKGLTASEEELERNPRARSARLRVIEKL